MRKIRLMAAVLVAVLAAGTTTMPLVTYADQAVMQADGVTVKNTNELRSALAAKNNLIIVDGTIAVNPDAQGISLTIPGGVTIQGQTSGSGLVCRGPIQLTGDGVVFRKMELHFNSTNALGGVPHREIFLAGHSLTLDDVDTYLPGGAGSGLGGFGGTENELLPTIYAGGFRGTTVGDNASVTVLNARSNTKLNAIYMSHDAGNDNKVAYSGTATVSMDAKTVVREGIHTDGNQSATVALTAAASYMGATGLAFYGNENTQLQLKNCKINETVINQVGSVTIDQDAELFLKEGSLKNVEVKNKGALNLTAFAGGTPVIEGDFTGGASISDPDTSKRGFLVLPEDGTVQINGTISGVTWLHTKYKNLPGPIHDGIPYVKASTPSAPSSFALSEKNVQNGDKLSYKDGKWISGEQSAAIHDIFFPKDNSKLERFKAKVLNGVLRLDTAIDVSELNIRPEEIKYQAPAQELTGELAAYYMVQYHSFYSMAALMQGTSFTLQDNGCVATVNYTYHSAWKKEFVERVIAGYDDVMRLIRKDDTDFAKILKFHDWIVKNVAYSRQAQYADFGAGALANRRAVCAGYAGLYQFLLEQEGIENIYVAAKTKTEDHAWNLVRYEGHWFHVDCTWDHGVVGSSTNVNHRYFMMSDEEFNADGAHTDKWKDSPKNYPTGNVCTIANKYYAANKEIATDKQIAQNPVHLKHQFDPAEPYTSSDKSGHTRKCRAGQLITEPHNFNDEVCAGCGYDTRKDPDHNNGGQTTPSKPPAPASEDKSSTYFNIFETDAAVSTTQISFEVPLYVTMAAVNGAESMVVPSADKYFIRNTCRADAEGKKQALGICGIKAEMGELWAIKSVPGKKYDMSFTLGGYPFGDLAQKEKRTFFDRTDWNKKLTETNAFFLKAEDNTAAGQIKPGLVPITDKLELPIQSAIAKVERKNTKTVPAFQVIYTLCAVDDQGQPMASVYVGNDKDEAFKEVVGAGN